MNFAGERYHFPENLIVNDVSSVVQEITYKFQTEVVDMVDQDILSAIIKTARENGITDLLILDKQFVLDALREKLERMKEDEHGHAQP